MGNKSILTLFIILICAVASAQAAQIYVDPAYSEVSPGENFTVNIMVNPEGAEVMGAEYKLYFTNTLLNATDQTKGIFLSQDGASTMDLVNKINNTLGKVEYAEFRMGVDYGVTNPGVLASITFQAIGEQGGCELILDDVVLSDPNASGIPGVIVTGGSVEIISGICGDVTCDGMVDIGDVILLSNYVGYYPGNPKYALNSTQQWAGEVTGDGMVDIGDVILLSNHVGYYPGNPKYVLNCV